MLAGTFIGSLLILVFDTFLFTSNINTMIPATGAVAFLAIILTQIALSSGNKSRNKSEGLDIKDEQFQPADLSVYRDSSWAGFSQGMILASLVSLSLVGGRLLVDDFLEFLPDTYTVVLGLAVLSFALWYFER